MVKARMGVPTVPYKGSKELVPLLCCLNEDGDLQKVDRGRENPKS